MNNPTNKIILTLEQESFLRENYAGLINHTICKELGISKRSLARLARAMGLIKDMRAIKDQHSKRVSEGLYRKYRIQGYRGTPENGIATRFKKGYDAKEFFGEEKFKRMREKAVETRKKLWAEDRARVTFGLPQRTRMRVKRQPQQKVLDRSYLKKRGYILDESNNIAYFTPETRRAVRMEAKPRRYYTFMQWKE